MLYCVTDSGTYIICMHALCAAYTASVHLYLSWQSIAMYSSLVICVKLVIIAVGNVLPKVWGLYLPLHNAIIATVTCNLTGQQSGDLQLVLNDGSTNAGNGRLEVFLNGRWGTVCEDDFGQEDGDVACRQLGYEGAIGYGRVRNFR